MKKLILTIMIIIQTSYPLHAKQIHGDELHEVMEKGEIIHSYRSTNKKTGVPFTQDHFDQIRVFIRLGSRLYWCVLQMQKPDQTIEALKDMEWRTGYTC